MKIWLAFILCLWGINGAFSCGMITTGDFTRYSILRPQFFDLDDFSPFHYSVDHFNYNISHDEEAIGKSGLNYESNIIDWWYYMNKRVSKEAIKNFMLNCSYSDISINSSDSFLAHLYKAKDYRALQYLRIAKSIESYSGCQQEKHWERAHTSNTYDIERKVDSMYAIETNNFLKRKYAFIGIRYSFYTSNELLLNKLYSLEFRNSSKDYLFYWANYFYNLRQGKPNFLDVVRIFSNNAEKRFASYFYFHGKFNKDLVLDQAVKGEDKAAVLVYHACQKLDKSIDILDRIYKLDPQNRAFCFLVHREVNKLEDWVLTPYYRFSLPAIEDIHSRWNEKDLDNTNTLLARAERDRTYAQEMLSWLKLIDLNKVRDKKLIRACEIQLLFIARRYEECLSKIRVYRNLYEGDVSIEPIDKIYCLALTARQEKGNAMIPKICYPIIEKYQYDEKFLFALGRELEYRENLTEGLALISTKIDNYFYDDYNASSWYGNYLRTSDNLIFFWDYFTYIDHIYSALELQQVISNVEMVRAKRKLPFYFRNLETDIDRLKDLLGTKYLRENKIIKARETFRSVDKSYWNDNYNPWERGIYQDEYSFEKNPFYSFKHTSDFIYKRDTFIVNKLSVIEHLIQYLYQAKTSKNPSYYYFIVANAYYNFSKDGNAWMMRRFYSTDHYRGHDNIQFIDDNEYTNKDLAQYYYQKAFETAKSRKFKALCLRMKEFVADGYQSDYPKMTKEFPELAYDLSSCVNLDKYFETQFDNKQ